jgi:CrcB protein
MGSFTTFSTFSLDLVTMLEANRYKQAAALGFGTPALGVGAAALGLALGRRLRGGATGSLR